MRVRSSVRRRVGAAAASLALMTSAGAVVLTAATASHPVGAATTTTVTNLDDDGTPTSLRGVLAGAGAGDTIELVAGATYSLDRCLQGTDVGPQFIGGGQLVVLQAVTINGNGATIEQTCLGFRVLITQADLTLNGVTITGGTSNQGGGGGIRVDDLVFPGDSAGAADTDIQLVIRNSSIVDNCTTSNGGGFKMNTGGDVTIVNSTIANNQASGIGGGLSHSHLGDVLMVNSTVTGNSSGNNAGVDVRGGDLTAVYSDIVANTAGVSSGNCGVVPFGVSEDDTAVHGTGIAAANIYVYIEFDFFSFGSVVARPNGGPNCSTSTTSSGYNFADDTSCAFEGTTDKQGTGSAFDPKLGTLASNGGPTRTLLPTTGSPLIDAIPNASCSGGDTLAGSAIKTDQRGLVRPSPAGGACDIGAVEIQVVPPTTTTTTTTTTPPAAAAVVAQPTFTG